MKLLFASDVFSGCTWYRHVIPAHEAQRNGHQVSVRIGDVARADIDWCDVFITQRLFQSEAFDAVTYAKEHGKLTVCDFDDDLWDIGPANTSYDHWALFGQDAARFASHVDRVTTTGPDLAATLREFNPDVRIIPNAVPADFAHTGERHDGIVLGWAGGDSHGEDLESVWPALKEVLANRPSVRMEMGGGLCLHHDRIRYLGHVNVEEYHKLLSRFDVGIAPLTDTRFNRAKSDLKPLEYAALGIPFVASDVGPYKTVGAGYLATSKRDWVRYLMRLIDDETERKRAGLEALDWANTRRIEKVLPLWESAWSLQAVPDSSGIT